MMNALRAIPWMIAVFFGFGWGLAAEPCAAHGDGDEIAYLLDEGLQRDLDFIATQTLGEGIEGWTEGCGWVIDVLGDNFGQLPPPSLVPAWLEEDLEGGHARWYLVQVRPDSFEDAESVLEQGGDAYGNAIFAAEALDLFVIYATRFEQFAELFDDRFIGFLVHVMENYPMRPAEWGYARTVIGLPSPAFGETDAAGVALAVVDTGVDPTHFGGALGTHRDEWRDFRRGRIIHEACFSSHEALLADSMETTSVCNPGDEIPFDYRKVFGADSVPPDYSLVGNSGMRTGVPCKMVNDCGHGSQVAFIAAGSDRVGEVQGVAPGASIVSIQVASKATSEYCTWAVKQDQSCVVIFPLDVIRALHYIVTQLESDRLAFGEMPLAAVNLSLHVNRYCDKPDEESESDPCDSEDEIGEWLAARYETACDDSLFTMLTDRLRDQRVWTVIAAGNRNPAEKVGFVSLPACVKSGITVAGVSVTDFGDSGGHGYTLAETSMYSHDLVDVAAPGVDLTTPAYVYSSTGTSFAAPQVTGLFALMRSGVMQCQGSEQWEGSDFLRWETHWLTGSGNGHAVTIPRGYYPAEDGITVDQLVPGLGLKLRASSLGCPS